MSHARSTHRAAIVAAVVLAACAATAGAQGAPLATPAIGPADRAVSWLTPELAAGARWRATVVITNPAPVARVVRLYAVDAVTAEGGAFAPAAVGERRRAGRWLRPAVGRLHLAAGERRRVGVEVRVPFGARQGVHPAAFVVQDARPPEAVGGVRLVMRAGLRVYVTVRPGRARSRPAALVGRHLCAASVALRAAGSRTSVSLAG